VNEVFSPSEYTQGYPEGIEFHYWNLARNDLLYRLLEPLVGEGELVMDVGCGPGIFLGSLQGKPVNARGIEKGSPVVKPGLESIIDIDRDLFDLDEHTRHNIKVVVLLDVIEHIADRRQFLQQIYREIPNCDHLLITVPARMEVWSDFDKDWGHFLRYDRPGLAGELRGSGFIVNRMSYYFQWTYLVMLGMKWMGIKRGSDFQSPTRNRVLAFCHRLLGALTRLESRLMPGFIPGSTIVCVATRDHND
jgi:SAM-dependent methyltransferase